MTRSRTEQIGSADQLPDQKKLASAWRALHALVQGDQGDGAQEVIEPRALPGKITKMTGDFGFSEAQKKAITKFIAKKRFQPGFKPETLNAPQFFEEMRAYFQEQEAVSDDASAALDTYITTSRAVVKQVFNPSVKPKRSASKLREELITRIDELELDPKLARYWQNYLAALNPENLVHSFPSLEEFQDKSDQILRRRPKRKEDVTQPTAHPTAPPPSPVSSLTPLNDEIKGFLEEGQKYLESGRYIKAVEAGKKAAKKNPRANAFLRKCYEQMSKNQEGGELLQIVCGVDAKDAVTRLFYGHFLLRGAKSEAQVGQAIAYYEAALELNPELTREVTRELINQGQNIYKAENHLQALSLFKQALAFDPENSDMESLLVDYYQLLRNVESGFEMLREMVERIDPKDSFGHFALGEIYLSINATEEAMGHFRIALKLRPTLETRLIPIFTAKMAAEKHQLAKLQKEKKKKTTAARIQAAKDSIVSLQQFGQNVAKIVQPGVVTEETEPNPVVSSKEPQDSRLREISEDDAEEDIEMPIHRITPEMSARLAQKDKEVPRTSQKSDREGSSPSVIIDPTLLESKSGEAERYGQPDEDAEGEDFDDPTKPSAEIYTDVQEVEDVFGKLKAYKRLVNLPGLTGKRHVYNFKKPDGNWVSRYWMSQCAYIKSLGLMKVVLFIDDYNEKKKQIENGEKVTLPLNPDANSTYLLNQEGSLLSEGFFHIDRFSDGCAAVWCAGGQTYIKADGDYLVFQKGENNLEELPGGTIRYKPFIFDKAWAFSEGRGRVQIGDKFRFITTEGDFLDGEFDEATDFENGQAKVRKGDEWQIIDRLGVLVPQYESERDEDTQPGVPNPLLQSTIEENTQPGVVPVPPAEPSKWSGPIPVPGTPDWEEYQMTQGLRTGETQWNPDPEDEAAGTMPAPRDVISETAEEDFGEKTPVVSTGKLREYREKLMPATNQEEAQKRMQLLYGIFGDSVGMIQESEDQEKVLEGVEEYRQLIEQFPETDFSHREMAKVLRELMEEGKVTLQEVKIAHQKDLRLNRNNWESWFEVALTYLNSDDLKNVHKSNKFFANALGLAERAKDIKKIKRYLHKIIPDKIAELLEASRNKD